jgi:hypothetical protein
MASKVLVGQTTSTMKVAAISGIYILQQVILLLKDFHWTITGLTQATMQFDTRASYNKYCFGFGLSFPT